MADRETLNEYAAELRRSVDWFWEQGISNWSIGTLTGRILIVADSLEEKPDRGALIELADHRQHGYSRKVTP